MDIHAPEEHTLPMLIEVHEMTIYGFVIQFSHEIMLM